MAQSRLEKIGTIFTRVQGLLRSKAMKLEDKPIWYDVYEAFPPKEEPRFDRPAPNIPVRKIFYGEDIVRAKYHQDHKFPETITLLDTKYKTNCQQFIGIYSNLKDQGALDDEQIIDTAKQMMVEKRKTHVQENEEGRGNLSLVNDFSSAKDSTNVNIKDIFKE